MDKHINDIAQLWSVGWDKQTSSVYNWSGTKRKDTGKYILQYTLSGRGTIEIDGRHHDLNPGQAFAVSSPSDYRYFLPKNSDKWEFIYITLIGGEAERCWQTMIDKAGHIITFHPESAPIRLLKEIYDEAAGRRITNAYHGSSLAYRFLMELYHYMGNLNKQMDQWPKQIVSAVLYAKHHFQENISPDEMALAAGLSRYHFSRLFKKTTGLTPIQYLTRIRILKAIELLQMTKYTVDEVALMSGYTNANYLNKVFRKHTGLSPGQIRTSKKTFTEEDLQMSPIHR
ncbi:AraC family transcriptional regulator [Bacillus lacus]|uniref:AraC family transcriptional regulator n=1 Tax=Metabacillus lacus TaxID=1983721 RepID=A0A7X2IWX9_9BACI|nr:AraC family transcriptional regulator [Metabacillus lacus]MRX71155.1 AraC family transcriptional regulator [Metabacillus lacus]